MPPVNIPPGLATSTAPGLSPAFSDTQLAANTGAQQERPFVTFGPPLGGALDDAAALQALLATVYGATGSHLPVVALPGTYHFRTKCNLAGLPAMHVVFGPGTRVIGHLVNGGTGAPDNSVFYAAWTKDAATTTLTETATIGATYVRVANVTSPALVVGSEIEVVTGTLLRAFRVVAAPTVAIITGTVDMTGLAYGGGGALDGKNVTVTIGGTSHLFTFGTPANAADAVAQLAAVLVPLGVTPSLGGTGGNKLVLMAATTATGTIACTNGTLATATVGITSGSVMGITVPISRAVEYAWAAGNTVYRLTWRPTDIIIDGYGASISGTCDRYFEIQGARRCMVRGWQVDDADGACGLVGSFDLGGEECLFQDVRLTCDGTPSLAPMSLGGGLMLEGNEGSTIRNCYVHGYYYGLELWDDTSGTIEGCTVERPAYCGISLAAYQVDYGCHSSRVVNCHLGGGQYGVQTQLRATDCLISGSRFVGCSYGVYLQGGANPTIRPTVVDCTTERCSTGYQVDATGGACLNPLFRGCTAIGTPNDGRTGFYLANGSNARLEHCRTEGLKDSATVLGPATLSDFEIVNGWNGLQIQHTAGLVLVSGLRAVSTSVYFLIIQNAGRTALSDTVLPLSGYGAISMASATSVLHLRNVRSTGSAGANYACNGAVAASIRLEGSVDFSSTANQYNAAQRLSRGTVTLNGASAVDYAFADIKAADTVRLQRMTAGGTPGAEPTYAITAGTKVAVTGTALDTSVYTLEIGG